MVDFAGWDMPLHYGSVIEEHLAVREHAGIFDVSHMTVVDLAGREAGAFLRRLLASDTAALAPGQARYTAMLNQAGGVVDDLIVYCLPDRFRLVVNCATHDKDLAWMERHGADFDITIRERGDLAILAVHGPEAIGQVCVYLGLRGIPTEEVEAVRSLRAFRCLMQDEWFIARTGYTGEQGLELIVPEEEANTLWDALLALDVRPVGLGARDTLRLEAGMNLYGHEMDDTVSPLSANMAGIIDWDPADREFIGRAAVTDHYRQQQAGTLPYLTGLVLEGRGVLRDGQVVHCNTGEREQEGIITSGTFSPTLNHSIALARVPAAARQARVDMRGRSTPVRLVGPCFVRQGRKQFS